MFQLPSPWRACAHLYRASEKEQDALHLVQLSAAALEQLEKEAGPQVRRSGRAVQGSAPARLLAWRCKGHPAFFAKATYTRLNVVAYWPLHTLKPIVTSLLEMPLYWAEAALAH